MAEKIRQIYHAYKPKINGLLFLMIVSILVLTFSLNILNKNRANLFAAKEELQGLVLLKGNLSQSLLRERNHEDSVKAFLVEWSPYLSDQMNSVKILESLEHIAHSKNCEITKKSTSNSTGKFFPVATLKTSLVGDLKDLLEFLSTAEERFPMMKIQDVEIFERANILSLDLTFKYPIFNEKV